MNLLDSLNSYFGKGSAGVQVADPNKNVTKPDDFSSLFDYTNSIYNQPIQQPSAFAVPGYSGVPSPQIQTNTVPTRTLVSPLNTISQDQIQQFQPTKPDPYGDPQNAYKQHQGGLAGLLAAFI